MTDATSNARTELRALEREILGVVTAQHRETRRGTTPTIIKASLGARSANDRVQIDRAIVRLVERGLLARVDMALLPAAVADEIAALAAAYHAPGKRAKPAAPAPAAESAPAAATTTAPAKPAAPTVDAAVVRRLRAEVDRLNGVLVMTQTAAEAARVALEPLLTRCAVMQLALMEDARRRYAAGDREALVELGWLRVTGELLLEHSAGASIAAGSAEPVAQAAGGDV